MRRHSRTIRRFGYLGLLILAVVLLFLVPGISRAAVYAVNLYDPDPNADAPDAATDGVCEVTVGVGDCSLRAALTEALPGDTITFAAPGGTISVIGPAVLPNIPGNVIVDGWSAGGVGYVGAPLVQVTDGSAGGVNIGLRFGGDGSTVIGLSVTGFDTVGVTFVGDGNQIYGSYIGLDLAGNPVPNNDGLRINGPRVDNVIGPTTGAAGQAPNVISGNTNHGILIQAANSIPVTTWTFPNANEVIGNYIGTNPAATGAIPNGDDGIAIANSRYVLVGRPNGGGNVIAGNGGDGIDVSSNNSRAINIRSNFIGVNLAQTAPIPNGGSGINLVLSQVNLIENNVIGGNAGYGIYLQQNDIQTIVCNNFIGVSEDGLTTLGNTLSGVGVVAPNYGVNGTGNHIGVGSPWPGFSPPACTVGNTITNNTGDGITVENGARLASARLNSIFNNGGDGIVLTDPAGANPSNEGVTRPVLQKAGADGGTQFVVDVTLNQAAGLATPDNQFEVDFYANDEPCVAVPRPEGQRYIGSTTVTVNGAGVGQGLGVPLTAAVALGQSITATASGRAVANPGGGNNEPWRNTSEFSDCIEVEVAGNIRVTKVDNPDPVVTGQPLTYTLTVNNVGVIPATNVTLTDTLPAGVTAINVLPGAPTCTVAGTTITCGLGTLAPGANTAVTVQVNAPGAAGTITNTAMVVMDEPDLVIGDNTVNTPTAVLAPTLTNTPTATFTPSDTPIPSATFTATASSTATFTPSLTPSRTPSATFTRTATPLPTLTYTFTPSRTPSNTPTPSLTPSLTPSRTPTLTLTPSLTHTPTFTPSATFTITPSYTLSPTLTQTYTPVPTFTPIASPTPLPTLTHTPRPIPTITLTPASPATATQNAILRTSTRVAQVSTRVSAIIEVIGTNPAETLVPGGPRITINKVPDTSRQPSGGQVAFNVTVRNQGAGAVSDVQLIEELLEGVVLVEVDPGQPTCTKTANSINCLLGRLEGGQSARVNFRVDPNGLDPLLGRTIVRSAELPDVALDQPYIIKFAAPAFIQPNGEVTWAIQVLNPTSQAATNLVITDILPPQLEVLSATSTRGTPVISADNRITLRVSRLNAVDSLTVTVRTRLRSGLSPSPVLSNNACLRTTQQPQEQCAQAPVFRIDQLPFTGESPWEARRLFIIAALVLSIGAVATWVVSRSHKRTQTTR